MELILLPNTKSRNPTLHEIYDRALTQSTELCIVSAYLTEWEIRKKVGRHCNSFLFIVGKDFGITRKLACRKVLDWLPPKHRQQFMAAESISGFHPKAIFWRELDGRCYALLGSSNLTKAAFSTNREANGYAKVTEKEFREAKAWIDEIYLASVTLNDEWLEQYREAVQPPPPPKSGVRTSRRTDDVLNLEIPDISTLDQAQVTFLLRQRAAQARAFSKNRAALEELFRKTSRARLWPRDRNDAFYKRLNQLWFFGDKGCRFQGRGWDRHGRHSDFREFSRSLVRVLDSDLSVQDATVSAEIGRMTNLKLTTRGALFSEMLCQFFPKRYHLLNAPISTWLERIGVVHSRGMSKGDRYINSARLLRAALRRARDYPAKNLAELDAIIWLAEQ